MIFSLVLIVALGCLLLVTSRFILYYFGAVQVESIFYHLQNDTTGTHLSFDEMFFQDFIAILLILMVIVSLPLTPLKRYISKPFHRFLYVIFLLVLLSRLLFYKDLRVYQHEEIVYSLSCVFVLLLAGFLTLRPCRYSGLAFVYTSSILFIGLISLFNTLDMWRYIHSIILKSDLYERYYVDPKTVNIQFPDKRPNLIYIYLESIENTLLSQYVGGGRA